MSYAINGRGMGHLVRQLAILRWIRQICALLDVRLEAWVLTSSEADTLARREGFASLKMPSKAMLRDARIQPDRFLPVARTWVLQTIAGLQPDLLLVDTFPAGSFGELIAALELAKHRVLVARRARPEFEASEGYAAMLPLYHQVLHPDGRGTGPIVIRDPSEIMPREQAREALGIPEGRRAVWVTLGGGGDLSAPDVLPRLVSALRAHDLHVVVGAGPLYQGREVRGDGVTWLTRYTPVELLSGVDVAVSAGGYNTFHELMMAGVPTVFLPQPRIADDQRERAQRAVDAGAGGIARSSADVADQVLALLDQPGASAAARSLVPESGARAAALLALRDVLPAHDLAMAEEVLTPELVELIARTRDLRRRPVDAVERTLEVVRLLSGGLPSMHQQQVADLARLADQGHAVPDLGDPGRGRRGRTARFVALCVDSGAPVDAAETLLRALAKKFPAADGEGLLAACEVLLPELVRFDDWMGVTSLMRALPTQRGYALDVFCADLTRWLRTQDDLFDALRLLARLEGSGERTVAEALTLLSAEAS